MIIPLEYTLLLSALLFSIGLTLVITRKNLIIILIGTELIFNAANVNLVAFNQFDQQGLEGLVFSLFVIVVAAAEVSVALAIIITLYRQKKSIDPDNFRQLHG
jgi:NADH:ubiquinone oxidoreductase subunit K